MLRVVVLLACGGCDMLYQLDHIEPVEEVAPPCDPFMDIKFDALELCAPLGHSGVRGGVIMTQGPDRLVIKPDVRGDAYGGCYPDFAFPFTADGIMVEVEDVLHGTMGEYTVLSLGSFIDLQVMAAAEKLSFTNNDGNLNYGDIPDFAYSPTEMRWWRLHRSSPTEVVAEYSADTKTWKRLGARLDVHTDALPYLAAGYSSAHAPETHQAVYRRMIVCN